jgi:putative oxidoreductase
MHWIIPDRWNPWLLSILRIVVAFLFIAHGTQKLFNVPPMEPRAPIGLFSQFGLAGLLETIGGTLMLLGLFTRVTAFVLAGEMAVAYFQVHAPQAFLPILNRGELAALYCFTFLYFAAAGPGPWSLDALLWRRTTAQPETPDRAVASRAPVKPGVGSPPYASAPGPSGSDRIRPRV